MAHYFGTDGIRGPIATSPLLTPLFLQQLGIAVSEWAYSKHNRFPTILFASDTRASCASIAQALAAGITSAGGTCHTARVLPTPALQRIITDSEQYDYGIMISASHNPATDNGIKLLTPSGKLTRGEEFSLGSLLSRTPQLPLIRDEVSLTPAPKSEVARYQEALLSHFPATMLAGLTIAVDCAHGATASLAPQIFEALGATVISTGIEPNGFNINHKCGSTTPQAILELTKKQSADFGFAFDGDGDRVVAVTQDGRLHDGDQLLALLATHPNFETQTALVGTVMSNAGLEAWLEKNGRHLLRTPVGDAHVLHAMKETKLLLGGEPSGHIIVGSYLPTSDGIFTALLALQAALLTDNKNMQACTTYPQITINIPIGAKRDLTQEPYASIIRAHTPSGSSGRSIVRYSGTEPVLRIMIEHSSYDVAHNHATQMAEKLQPLFTT